MCVNPLNKVGVVMVTALCVGNTQAGDFAVTLSPQSSSVYGTGAALQARHTVTPATAVGLDLENQGGKSKTAQIAVAHQVGRGVVTLNGGKTQQNAAKAFDNADYTGHLNGKAWQLGYQQANTDLTFRDARAEAADLGTATLTAKHQQTLTAQQRLFIGANNTLTPLLGITQTRQAGEDKHQRGVVGLGFTHYAAHQRFDLQTNSLGQQQSRTTLDYTHQITPKLSWNIGAARLINDTAADDTQITAGLSYGTNRHRFARPANGQTSAPSEILTQQLQHNALTAITATRTPVAVPITPTVPTTPDTPQGGCDPDKDPLCII